MAERILAVAIICTVLISFAKANSANPLSVYLAEIGFDAKGLILLSGLPAGLIGINKGKELKKLRAVTIVLSYLNLTAGIIGFGIPLLFCLWLIFTGATV